MNRFLLPAFNLALLLAVNACAQTESGLWRFVSPDAKAVIGIDWKAVQQSPAGNIIREYWLDGEMASLPGIEFLDNVERVLICSPGSNPEDGQSDPKMLIAVHGNFDLAKVRQALLAHGAKAQKFNSIAVYRPQERGARDLAFAPLDAKTILIGDASSVFAGLERPALPVEEQDHNAVVTRAVVLDATYDAWAVMASSGALAGGRLMAMFTGEDLGEETEGFEAGLSLRDGLDVHIGVNARTELAAKRLAGDFSEVLKLSAKDHKAAQPGLAEIEKKMKAYADGSTVRITLRLSKDEFDRNSRQLAAEHRTEPAAAVAQTDPPAKTDAPGAPEKRVIRIEGLDGGAREIPYHQ
jgi:hypothetical protein